MSDTAHCGPRPATLKSVVHQFFARGESTFAAFTPPFEPEA
jgi:hypothetical protein